MRKPIISKNTIIQLVHVVQIAVQKDVHHHKPLRNKASRAMVHEVQITRIGADAPA